MPTKKTTEQFIASAREKHGDRYDYSKVMYNGNRSRITITCKIHGDFIQMPHSHLLGHGCKKCSNRYRYTTAEFITKSREIHGDAFDYSKSIYIDAISKLVITCPIHGDFEQSPNAHFSGKGCSACSYIRAGIQNRKSLEEFLEDARCKHGNTYNYSKVDYISRDSNIIIICSMHGEFKQKPSVHLSGSGCPQCAGNIRRTTEKFIEDAQTIHGDYYDYSQSIYDNIQSKLIIICRNHGKFEQIASTHLSGAGCRLCVNKTEGKLFSWLKEKYPQYTIQREYRLPSLPKRRFDFLIEELKLFIELDGAQHFKQVSNWQDPLKTQQIDSWKVLHARSEGYSVIRVYQEDVFSDKNGWEHFLTEKIHKYEKPRYIIPRDQRYDDHRTCYKRLLSLIEYTQNKEKDSPIRSICDRHFSNMESSFQFDEVLMHDLIADIHRHFPETTDQSGRDTLLFFLCNILHLEVTCVDDEWTVAAILV